MHTYAYLELLKSVFSLNKQIFQLFQFIRAILRLLNHAKRLKFQNSKILYLESLSYDKNMVPILNRSILISKFCNSDNIQTWSHINVHLDILENKVSPHSMSIHSPYPYLCLYPYGYYRVWSVTTLHGDPHPLSISIIVSKWILQNVECAHTPCRLTVYTEYTVNP